MKTLVTLFSAALMMSGLYVPDADAARVGGGRNTGVQRSVTPPTKAAPQQQATQQAPAPAAAAAQPQGNRWLGPLAGLAAGLGLGWLISQGGFGGMGGVILAVLGALVLFALLRAYSRQKARAAELGTNAGEGMARSPLQYAGLGPQPVPAQVPGTGFGGSGLSSASAQAPAPAPNVPAGFDVAGFVKQAKINFLRLQEANDRGDVETIRDVCAEDLANELSADITARKGAPQHTEILGLDATLIEVVTESDYHFASISFSGSAVEQSGATPQPFQEVWNLRKPVSGDGGWQLAGIQQVS